MPTEMTPTMRPLPFVDLEKRGLIKGRWVEKAGQRRRRYYRYYRAGTDRAGKPALDLGEFHSRALERRAVASDLMIQAVFMDEDARSALKRVPWGKLTAVFAVAIVVAWVLGYLAGVFVRSGFGGLW